MVLILSSNIISNSDDDTNFPHRLSLTNTQVANLRKAFASRTLTDIKLSKTQLSKMIQLGRFLGRLLGPLLRTGLPLMKSVMEPLGVSETIKNEAKKQKGVFLSILLGTLGASLLGNMLAGKGVIRAGEGTARVGYGSKRSSLKKNFLFCLIH